MVIVDSLPRTPSPTRRRSRKPSGDLFTSARRSMSVGDADMKTIMGQASPNSIIAPPLPQSNRREDSPRKADGLNGILQDFKGELSQLDPISTTGLLDLRDPSTPSRHAAYSNSKADGFIDSRSESKESPSSSRHSSMTPLTPTFTLQTPVPEDAERLKAAAIIPARVSSLQTPLRSPNGFPSRQPPPSPLRTRSGNTFGAQNQRGLRVTHRSTASNSEPSLIPGNDETRHCRFPAHFRDLV